MNMASYRVAGGALRRVGWAVLALALAGCANPPPVVVPPNPSLPPSYVVLFPNVDGSIGKVLVTGREGVTLLERPRDGTAIGGPAGKKFIVSPLQIAKDFGAALAASPKPPKTFRLYFELRSTRMTPESRAVFAEIAEEIRQRPAPDISITGHTDTVGADAANAAHGLARARLVAQLIDNARMISAALVTIDSHGEKNLLVPTPDNTDEPRNRRVEVTVR